MIRKFCVVFTILCVSCLIYFHEYVRVFGHIFLSPDDWKEFQQALIEGGNSIEYCSRNNSNALNLPADFQFYGLSKNDARKLITAVNFHLYDECTFNARKRLKQALSEMNMDDYKYMVNSAIDSDLAQFKHDHINEFNQFIDEFELSPKSGGFDTLATVEKYAPIDD